MRTKNQLSLFRKRGVYFALPLIVTLLFSRIFLFFFPSANLYLVGYNIHHLYVGSVILILVLLMILFDIVSLFVFIISGVGTALVIDELVYLIATDGSDASYLGTASLSGAIISTIIIFILIGGGYYYAKGKK